jgi:hypothetical protein
MGGVWSVPELVVAESSQSHPCLKTAKWNNTSETSVPFFSFASYVMGIIAPCKVLSLSLCLQLLIVFNVWTHRKLILYWQIPEAWIPLISNKTRIPKRGNAGDKGRVGRSSGVVTTAPDHVTYRQSWELTTVNYSQDNWNIYAVLQFTRQLKHIRGASIHKTIETYKRCFNSQDNWNI